MRSDDDTYRLEDAAAPPKLSREYGSPDLALRLVYQRHTDSLLIVSTTRGCPTRQLAVPADQIRALLGASPTIGPRGTCAL